MRYANRSLLQGAAEAFIAFQQSCFLNLFARSGVAAESKELPRFRQVSDGYLDIHLMSVLAAITGLEPVMTLRDDFCDMRPDIGCLLIHLQLADVHAHQLLRRIAGHFRVNPPDPPQPV